jgi:protein-tyrosine phosphatase
MTNLNIHDLPAGGGKLALMPLPGRSGAYDADLAEVVAWGPDIVISMTSSKEMERHGAATFGADLQARGIRWVHLPVEDFGAPSTEISTRWPDLSEVVRRVLGQDGRVLVHCLGGCGRSGMVVLRLMLDSQEPPEAALDRLRAVRPCAVETEDQLRWATDVTRA